MSETVREALQMAMAENGFEPSLRDVDGVIVNLSSRGFHVGRLVLDVERLARAIDASWSDLLAPLGGMSDGLYRSAERVAAEYARLGEEAR